MRMTTLKTATAAVKMRPGGVMEAHLAQAKPDREVYIRVVVFGGERQRFVLRTAGAEM